MHYHSEDDSQYMGELKAAVPDTFKSFLEFDERALHGSNKEIPGKYSELIALAVALTTQCPYCIEVHVQGAKKFGASRAEIAETVMSAAVLRAGGAVAHGQMAMKFYSPHS